ncbi:MAG: extracellular solute-binding protein [Bifidobacteriaceae bacterium]|nr:extracellular solute-binding protein [Bifidobacteriaceae bacterium]
MASRFIKTLAFAAIGALALAGCSNKTDATGEADSTAKEITIWHMESVPTRVAAWNDLAEEFNSTDPAFKVRFEVQEWDQVYQKIAAAGQAGTVPDVLFAIPDFATYVRNIGLGQPVTDIVGQIDSDHQLLAPAKAAYTEDGEVYAVPLYGMVQVLWYNKDLFEAAKLDVPDTWNQLLAAAKSLTKDDIHGIALPAGKNLASDQVLYSFMATGGAANFFNQDGSVNLDRPETVAAFDIYNQLLAYSPVDSASYSWPEPQAALNTGAAAMAIEKGQFLSPWEAESGKTAERLGCAPIPVKDDGGKPGSIYYSNGAMVLSDDKDRRQGAAEFFKWVFEDDNYGTFLNAEPGLFLPVTQGGSELQSWRANEIVSTYSQCVEVMLDQSKTGVLFGFADGQYIKGIGDISGQNILAQAVQKMYVDHETPEAAVKWAQTEMETTLQ